MAFKQHNTNDGSSRGNLRLLAQLLGRTTESVRNRYYLLTTAAEQPQIIKKPKWTLKLIGELLNYLMDTTLSEDIMDLKDESIPSVVWNNVEKKLKIPAMTLRQFWLCQLHQQLFCTKPIYENDIKIMLIEYLYNKGISHRKELNWPTISKYFDGMTTYYLSRVFTLLAHRARCPKGGLADGHLGGKSQNINLFIKKIFYV